MYVNDFRPFSDERGLQSLQMLAYLSAAHNLTRQRGGGRTEDQAIFEKAYTELTNSTNQYLQNLLNLKITTPIDDNYSDDELTFLPFFTFLSTCTPSNYLSRGSASCPFDRSALLAALRRTFEVVRSERSNLWGAIMLAGEWDGARKG